MPDDLTIRLTNLRPCYSRCGAVKVIASFDLELAEAVRLRTCRLATTPGGFEVLAPERATTVAITDGAVRAAVTAAARRLYEEQRPGALVA